MTARLMTVFLLLYGVLLVVGASAQPDASPRPGAGPNPAVEPRPAGQTLGLRVLQRRSRLPTLDVVVIVPDAASFADAVAGWSPERVYPVLIDNGSVRAMQQIGRFVRGFEPASVVRYASGAELPKAAAAVRRAVDRALAVSQGAETVAGLPEAWREAGHVPMGVAVADPSDEAWVAALALAAGHGQPIVWIDRPGRPNVSGGLNEDNARLLLERIESGMTAMGLPWDRPGDVVDAVALCLNMPAKLRAGIAENQGERFAMTDLVGRHGALDAARLSPTPRWGWSGQIFGGAVDAAYTAMCSLFIAPGSAWLFDGYASTAPWNQFDMTLAGERLELAGLSATVYDEPRNTRNDWLLGSARALDAGLVMVNSSGRRDRFAVSDGDLFFRDAPVLRTPAAVSFVHSWSAQTVGNRDTVAGRWFERGAFAYIGSVHEPFLQAFVPTPTLATRLLVGMPWGVASRADGRTALWKIAVFGDPLFTMGRARPRTEGDLGLAGATALTDELSAAASERDIAAMGRSLVLLGRDADAAELARSVLADQESMFDAGFAELVVLAAFREGRTEALAAGVLALGPARAEAVGAADAIWLHAQPLLRGELDPALSAALRATLRSGTLVRDALALARAEARVRGSEAANRVLDAAERLVTEPGDAQRLRAARR
ncbi:MAG: hypothetical protein AAGF47_07690 [Planctomycetota bacterium]